MDKQTIHIWKGQEGTLCSLGHIPQNDSFVWLSKMGGMEAIHVNCKKCVNAYTKHIAKPPSAKRQVIISVLGGCASVESCPDDIEVEIIDLD